MVTILGRQGLAMRQFDDDVVERINVKVPPHGELVVALELRGIFDIQLIHRANSASACSTGTPRRLGLAAISFDSNHAS